MERYPWRCPFVRRIALAVIILHLLSAIDVVLVVAGVVELMPLRCVAARCIMLRSISHVTDLLLWVARQAGLDFVVLESSYGPATRPRWADSFQAVVVSAASWRSTQRR
jgi:hypothetical protein